MSCIRGRHHDAVYICSTVHLLYEYLKEAMSVTKWNLQQRTLAVLGAASIALLVMFGSVLIVHTYVSNQSAQEALVSSMAQQLHSQIRSRANRNMKTLSDWAWWDLMWERMRAGVPILQSEVTATSWDSLDTHLLATLDTTGRIREVRIRPGLAHQEAVQVRELLAYAPKTPDGRPVWVMRHGRPWVLMARSIRRSNGSEPIAGMLFSAASQPLTINLPDSNDQAELKAIDDRSIPVSVRKALRDQRNWYAAPDRGGYHRIYIALPGPENPVCVVSARVKHPEMASRMLTAWTIVVMMGLFGLVLVLVVIWLLRRLFLDRLQQLAEEVSASTGRDVSFRVTEGKPDEIGEVTRALNRLMEQVERQQRDLDYQLGFTQAVVELMPAAMVMKDLQGRYVMANQLAVQMIGRPMEQIIGSRIEEFTSSEIAQQHLAVDRDLVVHGGTRQYEAPHRDADGTVREYRFVKTLFRDKDGVPVGIIGVAVDITELRQVERELVRLNEELRERVVERTAALTDEQHRRAHAEQVLSHTEALYSDVVTDLTEWVVRWNADSQITFINKPAQDGLNMSGVDASCLPDSLREIAATLTPDQPLCELRWQSPAADGRSARWIDWTVRAIFQPNGALGEVQAVGRDVTDAYEAHQELEEQREHLAVLVEQRTEELRAVNDQLADAMRLRDELLSNMSHELRTPLTTVMGESDLLTDGQYGALNPAQEVAVSRICEQSEALLQLIDDLLDLSQIAAGSIELSLELTRLDELVRECLAKVQVMAVRRGVHLLPAPNGQCELIADRRRLSQVLLQLLHNAIKFTPDGGEVGIDLCQADGKAILVVHDTGIGIDPKLQEAVFDPFRQVDRQSGASPAGMGLGLPLARALVQLHGGTITVEARPHKGSRFIVTLPMRGPKGSPLRDKTR